MIRRGRTISLALSIMLIFSLLSIITPHVYANNNYRYNNSKISSYLTTANNGFMKVELEDDATHVYYYDWEYNLLKTKDVPIELSYTGGFFENSDSYFLFYGQNNPDESDNVEVIRIVKYDKNWNRLSQGSIFGENTLYPMTYGLEAAEGGQYIYVRTNHTMYKSSDGLNHQANMTFQFDKNTLDVVDCVSGVINRSYGYVSHSFNQYITIDDQNNIFCLDHGDAYPRSAILGMYKVKAGIGRVIKDNDDWDCYYNEDILQYKGDIGQNYTGANVGGLNYSSSNILTVGSSVRQDDNWSNNKNYNVYVSATPRKDLNREPKYTPSGEYVYSVTFPLTKEKTTKLNWLTSYKEGASDSATKPKLVKINDNYFLVIWGVSDKSRETQNKVSYAFINGAAELVGPIKTVDAWLSDCQPVVANNRVTWYVDYGAYDSFYAIGYEGMNGASTFYTQKDISSLSFSKVSNYTYSGKAYEPKVTIKDGSKTLTEGKDYKVTYENNVNAGTASINIRGIGAYTNNKVIEFKINPLDISKDVDVDFNYTEPLDSSDALEDYLKNNLTLKYKGKHLMQVEGYWYGEGDYYYSGASYSESKPFTIDNLQYIYYSFTGNYTGSIVLRHIKNCETDYNNSVVYTGSPTNAGVKLSDYEDNLTEGSDYSIEYKNNVNVGEASFILRGKNRTFGQAEYKYRIEPKKISELKPTLEYSNVQFDGTAKRPQVSIKYGNNTLVNGKDFTAEYKNNTNSGTATVTIKGLGNYSDTKNLSFSITPISLSDGLTNTQVSGERDVTYTGSPITHNMKVTANINGTSKTLVKDKDYIVSYKNNVNAGTAVITIAGKGNYSDSVDTTFKINKVNLEDVLTATNVSGVNRKQYTGSEVKLNTGVTAKVGGKDTTLKNGIDYKETYDNNVQIGQATVTITGTGNYEGTISKQFAIIEPIWERLYGNGRYDTMRAIVNEGFTKTGGTVVVATGTGFKDALAASGLAGLDKAPVVLTDGKNLSSQAKSVLQKLKPKKIYIAGGTVAVKDAVLTQIKSVTGVTPKRLFGQTSSGTSAALANEGKGRWKEGIAIIATNKSFKDALSVAPIAYAKGYPILLADNGKSLSGDVLKALKNIGTKQVIIVGGTGAVTTNVETQLRKAGISIKARLWGQTGVETSRAIAEWGIKSGLSANRMGVATSQNYPDALAGAALCGYNKAVLVLADDKAMLNTTFPISHKSVIQRGYVFGGTLAVGDKTFMALEQNTL